MIPWTRFEPLADAHRLDEFTCDNGEMDKWFLGSARDAMARGTCTTQVLLDGDGEVVGFFGLVNATLRTKDLTRRLGGTGVDEAKSKDFSSILIARLGLHSKHQEKGYGMGVVLEAIAMAVQIHQTMAATKYIMIDAKDEGLATWYTSPKIGFTRLSATSMRLVMKMSEAVRRVEAARAL